MSSECVPQPASRERLAAYRHRELNKKLDATEFFDLCGSGTPQDVQSAILAGSNVNARRQDVELTPLMVAVQRNMDPEVKPWFPSVRFSGCKRSFPATALAVVVGVERHRLLDIGEAGPTMGEAG